jgi:hypothetical protein
MKKIAILSLSVAALILLTQCHNASSEDHGKKSGAHGKDISAMMNDETYLNEVMDSMRTNHPDVLLSSVFVLAKDDRQMQEGIMDHLIGLCKMDSSTYKMMMGKTMDMADADFSKCNMMMGSMHSHPNVKKAAQKSMCGMKGM